MATKNITTTKTPRVTNVQRYEDIIALLEGRPVANGTTQEQAVAFCLDRIEKVKAKNATENKKPTKTQEANVGYKADVLAFLRSLPEDDKGKTCSEILRGVPAIYNAGWGVPKIASLCYMLVEDGTATVEVVKSKNLFRAVR